MIVFYLKETGKILGTIDGRSHDESHLKMNIPSEEGQTEKIIINWKPVKYYDVNGIEINPIEEKDKIYTADFEPDHEQKEIIVDIETGKKRITNFKIDPETKLFIEL